MKIYADNAATTKMSRPALAAMTACLKEIYGICLLENKASVRVMEKCGFENIFKGEGMYQGQNRDIIKNIWKA